MSCQDEIKNFIQNRFDCGLNKLVIDFSQKKSIGISYYNEYCKIIDLLHYLNRHDYDFYAVRETKQGFIHYGYGAYFDEASPDKLKCVMLKLENNMQILCLLKVNKTILRRDIEKNYKKRVLFSDLFAAFDFRIQKNNVYTINDINRLLGKKEDFCSITTPRDH